MAWNPDIEGFSPYPRVYLNLNSNPTILFTVFDTFNEIDFDPGTLTGTSDFVVNLRIDGIDYLVYNSNGSGFEPDFAGSTLTKVVGGSVGGYDAFNFSINTSVMSFVYDDDIRIRLDLTDPGQDAVQKVWFIEADVDLGIVVESIIPPDGYTNAARNTNLSFTIASNTEAIQLGSTTTISITDVTNSISMWNSLDEVFQPGYDGPSSSYTVVPGGSIDGYDAYDFVIDFTSDFNYGDFFQYGIEVSDTRTYQAS